MPVVRVKVFALSELRAKLAAPALRLTYGGATVAADAAGPADDDADSCMLVWNQSFEMKTSSGPSPAAPGLAGDDAQLLVELVDDGSVVGVAAVDVEYLRASHAALPRIERRHKYPQKSYKLVLLQPASLPSGAPVAVRESSIAPSGARPVARLKLALQILLKPSRSSAATVGGSSSGAGASLSPPPSPSSRGQHPRSPPPSRSPSYADLELALSKAHVRNALLEAQNNTLTERIRSLEAELAAAQATSGAPTGPDRPPLAALTATSTTNNTAASVSKLQHALDDLEGRVHGLLA
ncbi:uncharacterized protein AMSG_04504 [Thecamonas trahens ATCC 50062]|uniref:C2 NT-type domain-containing protein n=1 Tax=Thecamonas trahens ATCC 50062 TaxID=461836 RepID=A0A0L0D7E2_THETB|nr:hypothetical protein AMSG_04504 [Thecamonas trahens ATCC 50062]KNC48274.1 hypothetical protein AMSG_04504 [Thecamonas trahens ATCC 50062]|eukprot:XP_013758841.1 hypothetical protein AMSG_04504 [Thecamonas trahens ATCC 50062]